MPSFFLSLIYLEYNVYLQSTKKINKMGRGDKKTKAGKIFKGSFGKFRSSKTKKGTPQKTEKKA